VVNIHNPGTNAQNINCKFASAEKGGDGLISDWEEISIGRDGAQSFDCDRFHKIAKKEESDLMEGFFVIESGHPLDVVALYTTNDVDGNGVPGIAIERVPQRTVG
jgi:hypothetical protein